MAKKKKNNQVDVVPNCFPSAKFVHGWIFIKGKREQ